MAEILVKAIDASHADPEKDARGCYKRGMAVVVMPDGWPWGNEERLPRFVVIKIPSVSPARVRKYVEAQLSGDVLVRRRLWQIRVADLPAAARNKLATAGELIIKADPAYEGSFDYTWAQVKGFFRNLATGLDETADI